MKVFRLLVPVSNIEAATEFYGSVFRQAGERVSAGRHYFNCDGVTVACFDPVADGDDYSASPFSEPIYFSVDDLDAVLERVAAAGGAFSQESIPGVGVLGKIENRPWGERSFYMSDPFGNPLCFVSSDTVFSGDTGNTEGAA